ncbi:MAG TPA: Ig-like domain-containing protein [Anaeromyxobacter sp.]|nr:Ig-like domain-containing protein [Anaeromyxobacter sp.]
MTGPAAAAVGAPAMLQATAGDDRGVRRVAFEVEDVLVGDASSEPFQAGWIPPAPGGYRVVARAWDAAGNEGVSAPYVVQAGDRTPPQVAWVVPTEWGYRPEYAGGAAPFAVEAEDLGGGTVSRVELLVDGAVAATVAAPPWEGSWDTGGFAEGLHELVARALDDSGNAGATRPIAVRIDRTPPADVTIVSPTAASVVSGAVPVTVRAVDAGRIASVSWSADGVVFGAGASTTWDARAAAPGPHVLRVVVTDAAGNAAEASVTVRVQDLRAPTVRISVSPSHGDVTAASPDLYASASDDVAVVRTELYLDGMLVVASGHSSAATTWDASGAEGRHELLARAVDAAGNVGTATRTIEVDLTPPSVQVIAPAPGETLEGAVTVAIATADAHAIGGAQLFLDGRLVATASAPPFDLPLDARFVPSGPYVLTVRAWDVVGNAATSADVPVEVRAPEAAVWDPALGVPRCASAGAACRAGFLLDGSGRSELHWPNTLGGAADDPSLTFGAVDAIEVATVDGGPLAAGKTARVRVLLHGGQYVRGKIFATTDPALPRWQFVGYVGSSRWDATWYETTFVLPSAPAQAIRVANGVDIDPDPVSGYNADYDDLVFAVLP